LTTCDSTGKGFMDYAFIIMFPIQLSAFLMTLVRKNIITNNLWHVFYGLSLTIPYIPILHIGKGDEEYLVKSALTVLYIILRLVFHLNKYFLMANTMFLYLYYVQTRCEETCVM